MLARCAFSKDAAGLVDAEAVAALALVRFCIRRKHLAHVQLAGRLASLFIVTSILYAKTSSSSRTGRKEKND